MPLLRHSCPLAAVQVPLTTRPPGEVITAWPPGLSVTVLVTPLVVTEIRWPTISAPGVQPCAKAVPDTVADRATVRPASVRARFALVIMKHPSGRPKGVNTTTIDRFPRVRRGCWRFRYR